MKKEELLDDNQNLGSIKTNKVLSAVNIVLLALIVLLISAIATLYFFITPMIIDGDSMQNTLQSGDLIWAQKVGIKCYRGDIVIFDRPGSEKPPIKRIIGVAGDLIQYDSGQAKWLRNGEIVDDSYCFDEKLGDNYFHGVDKDFATKIMTEGVVVGEGELFVLGDHRSISYDSHSYGCIKTEWVKGRCVGK